MRDYPPFRLAIIAAVLIASLLWALQAPAQQNFDAAAQQAIFERLQSEIAVMEKQRAELDHELGQRKEQRDLLGALLETNTRLVRRVQQLTPPTPAPTPQEPTP